MSDVLAFFQAHSAVVSGFVVALLDLAFALSPTAAANGLLHQVYLWFKKPAPPTV